MTIGPFLRRELATSSRNGRVFSDRRAAALLAGLMVVGCLLLWDRQGWDRTSLAGARRLGLAMFGMTVVGMVLLAYGVVLQQVTNAIAAERDKKTLDALLATRFSSLEIVLGAVAAGLFRLANGLGAAVPVVVLVVSLVGIPMAWAALAGLGLVSMACFLSGLAAVASVGARTRARAVAVATWWFAAWFVFPTLYLVLFRPLVWPSAPIWLTDAVLVVHESSPMAVLNDFVGVIRRPGGPMEVVARMVAWQLVGAVVLLAWATARLRPASRSLYDVEGERGRLRRLKASLRRPRRRPPCSDDPVFWSEAYSRRTMSLLDGLVERSIVLASISAVVAGLWWFAVPAFRELFERGYGASPEAFAMPELHPLMRLLIKARMPALSASMFPGQARLEFNIVLRLFTGLPMLFIAAAAFSAGVESITRERRRETWFGLLATPLTAREILRGKARGSLWRLRWTALVLVSTWVVGLLAGAVHPLGFLASLGFLAAAGVFYVQIGLMMALREYDPDTRRKSRLTAIQAPTLVIAGVLLTAGPMILGWASLFTYEDVAAVLRAGPLPELRDGPVGEWVGARGVLLALLGATGALAFGARWLDRKNEREFDRAVGRPVRVEGRG